jgi:ADP-heptose:LPS heptosyltransferase
MIDNVFFSRDEKSGYDAYVSFFGPTQIRVPDDKPFYGVAMDVESVTKYSEVLLNFAVAKELGYDGDMKPGFFQTIVPEDPPSLKNFPRRIVIAPGSKFNRFGMCKKYRGYDMVANALGGNENVIFIGTESDKAIHTELSKFDWYIGKDVQGLLKCAYIAANCKLLISNDTGFMHLRAITGKPQIAIFGPSGIAKNLPYNNNAVVISEKLDCVPCQKTSKWETCDNDCMNIYYERITSVAERFLKEGEQNVVPDLHRD